MAIAPLPLIDACLDGDIERVCALVDATHRTQEYYSHYIAIHAATIAILDSEPPVEAYRKLRRVLDHPVSHPQIFLLLLRYASLVAIRLRHYDEAERWIEAIGRIDSTELPPTLKSAALMTEAALHETKGDFSLAYARCGAAMETELAAPSAFWAGLKSLRAYYGICCHEFATAERDIRDIEAHETLHSNLCAPLLALRVQLCCESGLVEKGLALLDAVLAEDAGIGRRRLVTYCVQLLLKAGRLDEAAVMLDQADNSEPETLTTAMSQTLRAIEALAHQEVDAARGYGRAAIRSLDHGVPMDFDLSLRTLAMAELAARRPSEARRILIRLDPGESKTPAQLLWARLHLLEGNPHRAAIHFRRVVGLGPTYLVDSLRYAFELSAHQLAQLQEAVQSEVIVKQVPIPPNQGPTVLVGDKPVPLVGHSDAIRRIVAQASAFATLPAPVLITGETGTGKDVVARLLHAESLRAAQAFLPVNCGALSDTLIESELFGHVKGAFTGAARDHEGLFVAAGAGTIFLDEVHAMSPRLQAALLRVLENGEVRPVGSSRFQRTDARVLAATNESLQKLMTSGRFRTDLYYRLAKLKVNIPPLRDRPDDIVPLARHFLREFFGNQDFVLGDDLIEAMKCHPWPGNVRQLRNEIERIILTAGERRVLTAQLLDLDGHTSVREQSASPLLKPLDDEVRGAGSNLPRVGRRHMHSRRRRLRELIDQHEHLTRAEVVQLLECSPNTATRDLRALEQAGYIRRVHTSAHLRTSYFVRNV